MFAGLPVSQPSTRRWSALASFTLQTTIVVAVLILPMLWPQNLSPVFLAKRIFVPTPDGERAAAPPSHASPHAGGPSLVQAIVVSRDLPRDRFIATASTDDLPPVMDPVIGTGNRRSAIDILAGGPSSPVLPSRGTPRDFRASVVMEGNLVRRVEPQYPAIARQIRLEGTVVLNAIISREGNIERVDVASGPALLALAARDAVRQWKYRPYLLNGEPVEVETQVTVNFVLGH